MGSGFGEGVGFFVFNCRLVQFGFETTGIAARLSRWLPAPAVLAKLVEMERARSLGSVCIFCVLCDVLSRCLKTFDTLWDGFGGGEMRSLTQKRVTQVRRRNADEPEGSR